MTEPRISVVISSLDGARTLGACLDALKSQTLADEVQVVVVDDGSSDATARVAREHGAEVVVHDRNLGISMARNSGIAAARAPIVAFTDDDCVPEPDWLERLVVPYGRPEVIGVGGSIAVHRQKSMVHRYLAAYNPLRPLELGLAGEAGLLERLGRYLRRMWQIAEPSGPRAVFSFPGANMSFRREALAVVGGFDGRMTFGADDEYICARVRSAYPDKILWFEPGAVVRHDFVGTLRDLCRRNYAYGFGHARVHAFGDSRQWPIVFPAPLATAVGVTAMRRSWRLLVVPLVLQLLLPQGIVGMSRSRKLRDLSFCYLRLLEETAYDLGMFVGLLTLRRDRRSR